MHTLKLTTAQVKLITAALDIVSPSGGGSDQHALQQQILSQTGTHLDITIVRKLARIAEIELQPLRED